jgi:predicted nucleotidyltransferase
MSEAKFGLGATVVASIQDVFAAYPEVHEVILYGSRAKGNFKVGSDIDLTMIGDDINFDVLSKISQELYDLPIPYTVDLSIFSNIDNAALREHIERVGIPFFKRKEA